MRKKSPYILFLFLLGILPHFTKAQSRNLIATYLLNETEITGGELVSNILKVINPNLDTIVFRLETDYPAEWKQLSRPRNRYSIPPGDSLFLPLRYIPGGVLTGNNRFMLSAFLIDMENQQLATSYFWAFTMKKTSWSLGSVGSGKVYFKNGESVANFKVSVVNTGTETQPIILTLNNMSLFSEITDSAEKNIVVAPSNFQLKPFQDTSFQFKFRYIQGKRNAGRIDLENYRPDNLNEEKIFNLLIATEEPNYGQPGIFQAGQRLTFKKLSDDKKITTQTSSQIPLVVDYNVNNLMDEVSFTTINLRGITQLTPQRQVIYNLQTSATSTDYNSFIQNNNYYLGYFYERGNFQTGFINGGLAGIQSFGKGLKASYGLDKHNRKVISGFLIRKKDNQGREVLNSYGGTFDFKYYKQNNIRLEMGQSNDIVTGLKSTAFTGRVGIAFLKTQSVNFSLTNTINQLNNPILGNKQISGYFLAGNYVGSFLKNKLNISHSASYNNPQFSIANIERMFYTHRARIIFNDRLSAALVNNYNNSIIRQFGTISNISSQTNQFSINRSFNTKSIQPQVFFNRFQQFALQYDMTGGGINFNSFNTKSGTRITSTFEAGVNLPRNIIGAEKTTFIQVNSLVFLKTISLNLRYVVGTYGYVPNANTGGGTQQLFTTSAQHQYVFKSSKFVLQTGMNYFYNKAFKQHSATLSPDFYYFTPDGWRFRFSVNYNFISSIALRNTSAAQQSSNSEQERIKQQNIIFSVGVRKEFFIPIPSKKFEYCNVGFDVFYDVNGNGIKDKNERPIENVVLRIGDVEIITNQNGNAKVKNLSIKRYNIAAFPLEELDGWFANINDTILVMKNMQIPIPFVRGVRIRGRVGIDRETINADSDDPFDLSGIRITAAGKKEFNSLTDTKGNFQFYLPYGVYQINVDEGVLGNKYKLAKNNIEVESNRETDGMVISFLIIEKKRKIIKKTFPQPTPSSKTSPLPNSPKGNQKNPPPRKR